VVALDLKSLDFSPKAGVRSVALEGKDSYSLVGLINKSLKPSAPIAYLAP
jgi:hypothetical protein